VSRQSPMLGEPRFARWLLLLVAASGACERLNSDWCTSAQRCSPGQRCDPSTNTCQPGELGLPDSGVDHAIPDRKPDRRPDLDPCAFPSGGYTCVGGAVTLCTDGGPRAVRNCPDGGCAYGHCQTPQPPILPCKRNTDCVKSWLCTMLLGGAGTPESICAPAVLGAQVGGCTSGLDCATGLCTPSGQCYYACDADGDCPTTHHCQPGVNLLVEGVAVTTKSCEP